MLSTWLLAIYLYRKLVPRTISYSFQQSFRHYKTAWWNDRIYNTFFNTTWSDLTLIIIIISDAMLASTVYTVARSNMISWKVHLPVAIVQVDKGHHAYYFLGACHGSGMCTNSGILRDLMHAGVMVSLLSCLSYVYKQCCGDKYWINTCCMPVYSYSAASCLCNCTSPSKGNSKESFFPLVFWLALQPTCNQKSSNLGMRSANYIVGVVFCCLVAIRTFYSNQL